MLFQILLFVILAIVIGLALCFAGYALFRILFPIWGFLIGLWLGAEMVSNVFGSGTFLTTSLGLIIGFLFGLLLAGLAYYVYAFAVILAGATFGYAIGAGLMLLLGVDPGMLTWLVGVAMAVIFAVAFVSMSFPKVLLMVVTGFAGASAIIAGILALFGQVPPEKLGLAMASATIHSSWFWWIVWVVIAMFGVMTQYGLSQAAATPEAWTYDSTVGEAKPKKKEAAAKEEKPAA